MRAETINYKSTWLGLNSTLTSKIKLSNKHYILLTETLYLKQANQFYQQQQELIF